jgi:hypothetical protein
MMPAWLRTTLALLGGAAVAVLVVSLGDALVARMWPLPEGTNVQDRAALRAAIRTLPTIAFATMVLFWSLACAVGAFIAARASAGRKLWPGLAVAALITTSTLVNLLLLPHPAWLWVAVPALLPPCGVLAAQRGATPVTAAGDVAQHPHVHA